MRFKRQRSIKESVEASGLTLHTGTQVSIRLRPAEPDMGIVFKRTDIDDSQEIKLDIDIVHSLERETSIQKNGLVVRTVEHLLSALSGFGIDNVIVEVSGEELPIGDGSSKIYVDMIKRAGIVEYSEERAVLEIVKPVYVRNNGRCVIGLPSDEFKLTYVVSFDHPAIGTQMFEGVVSPETYEKEIAPARTFGFLAEAETLYSKGLALGGNYDNVVVVGDFEILNGPLRFPNEFARHKALDLIGDLYITGKQVIGHIIAIKAGHQLHIEFLKEVIRESGL